MTDAERAASIAESWRLTRLTEALLFGGPRLVGREPTLEPEPPLAKVLEFKPRSA